MAPEIMSAKFVFNSHLYSGMSCVLRNGGQAGREVWVNVTQKGNKKKTLAHPLQKEKRKSW